MGVIELFVGVQKINPRPYVVPLPPMIISACLKFHLLVM